MEPADSDSFGDHQEPGAFKRIQDMSQLAVVARRTGDCFEASEIRPRRLDVDTEWLQDTGVNAAKDRMSVEEFLQVENQSEEKLNEIRAGAEIRAGCIEGIQLFRSKGLSADG